MYHIAFFLDFRPFLEKKVVSFLHNDFSQVLIHKNGQEHNVKSLRDLPKPDTEYIYRYFWFLHGGAKFSDEPSRHPEFHLYKETSFSQINYLFQWFAERYSWVLFPWGGTSEYMSLAFVTSEAKIRDKFIACSENSAEVYRSFNIRNHYNMLISSYDIESKVEDVCKNIVFNEFGEAGHRVWESCNCSEVKPYVIYNEYDEESLPDSWLETDFTVIGSVGPFEDNFVLSIYRPRNKRSFMAMCNHHTALQPTLIVLPGTSALGAIPKLLEKTEDEYSYSDLCYMQDYLDSGEWFYALGRCHQDEAYSLFVSKESCLTRKIVELPNLKSNDGFRLISCL